MSLQEHVFEYVSVQELCFLVINTTYLENHLNLLIIGYKNKMFYFLR